MKISIITPVFNARDSIEDCIRSVLDQKNTEVEHIIVDGGSTDGTLDIIEFFSKSISLLLSGPDNGAFDAMNKGILMSTGEVIGILNSDDFYGSTDVLSTVNEFLTKFETDSCFGDLDYVSRKDKSKIVRRWRSKEFYPELFRKGWMPPHPAFFVKKKFYDNFGMYNLAFPLAADYEFMLRLLYVRRLAVIHIPKVFIKMRRGGKSRPGIINTAKMMSENYRAWKINGLNPNLTTIILKPLSKIGQFSFFQRKGQAVHRNIR